MAVKDSFTNSENDFIINGRQKAASVLVLLKISQFSSESLQDSNGLNLLMDVPPKSKTSIWYIVVIYSLCQSNISCKIIVLQFRPLQKIGARQIYYSIQLSVFGK